MMPEPMSDARLAKEPTLASWYDGEPVTEAHLDVIRRELDAGGAGAAQFSRSVMRKVVAEVDRLRNLLGEPEIEWGHQVHGNDGWIGESVPQGDEWTARAAVAHVNAQAGPGARVSARLVVHEVWHAETEWRVVDDGAQ